MRVRSITNISNGVVTVALSTGNSVDLLPGGMLTNVTVMNLAGISIFVKVLYALND